MNTQVSDRPKSQQNSVPLVTRDARFRAAKKLKQSGRVHLGAIPIFETLVNRAEEEFGTKSIETAVVYYELGHSMFLNISRNSRNNVDQSDVEDALEYMVKACSILYDYDANNSNPQLQCTASEDADVVSDCLIWVKDEIPRYLIGIGNVQSYQAKHADALESYLNALPYREEVCDRYKKESHQTVASLRHQRLLAETYVLIAEELMNCKPEQDVVHSETCNVIVRGEEITSLTQSYYDQARNQLQDIVYFMATLVGQGPSPSLDSEKQDICHLATLLIEVGMSLAQQSEEISTMPLSKKPKVV